MYSHISSGNVVLPLALLTILSQMSKNTSQMAKLEDKLEAIHHLGKVPSTSLTKDNADRFINDRIEAWVLHAGTWTGLNTLITAATAPNLPEEMRMWMTIGAVALLATSDVLRTRRSGELREFTKKLIDQGPLSAITTYGRRRLKGWSAANSITTTSLAIAALTDLRDVNSEVTTLLMIPVYGSGIWTSVRSGWHEFATYVHGIGIAEATVYAVGSVIDDYKRSTAQRNAKSPNS